MVHYKFRVSSNSFEKPKLISVLLKQHSKNFAVVLAGEHVGLPIRRQVGNGSNCQVNPEPCSCPHRTIYCYLHSKLQLMQTGDRRGDCQRVRVWPGLTKWTCGWPHIRAFKSLAFDNLVGAWLLGLGID